MNVLMTGATGFIGSHLAESLHAKGHKIRCLVRKTSNMKWIRHLPLEHVHGDFDDADSLRHAVAGADVVYHVAGVTKAKTREGYFHGNHLATKHLLEAVRDANPKLQRFLHVSSQAAVGPSPKEKPIDETTPFHPLTAYGASKMEAEKECLKFASEFPVTIVRPPAVYGPREADVFTFFKTMSRGIQPMIGLHDTYVSLIHIGDLVRGTIMAAEHPSAVGQTYFITSACFYNWRVVGDVTARVMATRALRIRIPIPVVYVVAAFAELGALFSKSPALLNFEKVKDIIQDAWTCDGSKAKRELGFAQDIELETGVRETIDWYRNEGWL